MKYYLLRFVFLFFPSTLFAQTPVEKMPDFVFYRLNKSTFTKKDLKSGKMSFFVFFDSDCEHCQHAMHDIDMHINRFKQTAVYLVTLDKPAAISNFMHTYGPHLGHQPDVTILRDLRNEFIVKFNPRKCPSMLLYSANGGLIVYEDDDNNISRIYTHL